jgi:CHAD domain-containing protein
MNSKIRTVLSGMAANFQETQALALRVQSQNTIHAVDLHALRIGLRKIEASLRIVHRMKRKSSQHPALVHFKTLLKDTGAARNEEALLELTRTQRSNSEIKEWLKEKSKDRAKLESKIPLIVAKSSPMSFGKLGEISILNRLATLDSFQFKKRAKKIVRADAKRLKKMSTRLKRNKNNIKYLHGFRIQAKKLRYLMEQLEPVIGHTSPRLKSAMKKNQDRFGRLHDLDSALRLAKPYPTLYKNLQIDRQRTLKKALKSARKLRQLS